MCDFITVTISLWKSERPVSKTKNFWEQFELLFKNRFMHDRFEGGGLGVYQKMLPNLVS